MQPWGDHKTLSFFPVSKQSFYFQKLKQDIQQDKSVSIGFYSLANDWIINITTISATCRPSPAKAAVCSFNVFLRLWSVWVKFTVVNTVDSSCAFVAAIKQSALFAEFRTRKLPRTCFGIETKAFRFIKMQCSIIMTLKLIFQGKKKVQLL